jgi:hypothetical protein
MEGELGMFSVFLQDMLRKPEMFHASFADFLGANSWSAPVIGYLRKDGRLSALEDYVRNKPDATCVYVQPTNTEDREKVGEKDSICRMLTVWVVLPLPPEEGVPNRFHFKEVGYDEFRCVGSGSIYG